MTKAEQASSLAGAKDFCSSRTKALIESPQTCRHFGISRQTFYKWKAAVRAARRSRPVRPAACASALAARDRANVVSKILYLRQYYHFGPGGSPTT